MAAPNQDQIKGAAPVSASSAAGKSIPPTESANSAEWLRVTLSSIGDGVITTDAYGRVTFLNPVAEKLTGWTQEQAVSREATRRSSTS